MVKPQTCRTFAEFCLDVYDAALPRGWQRLATQEQPDPEREPSQERILVESCPLRRLEVPGLKPCLPAPSQGQRSGRVLVRPALHRPHRLQPAAQSRQDAGHRRRPARLALEERNSAAARIVGNLPGGKKAIGVRASSCFPCRRQACWVRWLH